MFKKISLSCLFVLLLALLVACAPQVPNLPRTVTGGNSVTITLGEGNPIFTVRSSSANGELFVTSTDSYALYNKTAGDYVKVDHSPASTFSKAAYTSRLEIKNTPDVMFAFINNGNVTVTFSSGDAEVQIIVGK